MAQNIYDNEKFFTGYSTLPRSVEGLDGAPEWPSISALIPDLGGKRVVDLGCGFGWFSRWARVQGASQVLGLDLSENMLNRAREDTTDESIHYETADLEQLQIGEMAFDFAYSSLAFHYVEDFQRLVATIFRALVPGSYLVFSIEHPIFMAARQPMWLEDTEGRITWPVNCYAMEGKRTTDWFADGVVKYHRTVATTLNTLLDTGFDIARVIEFAPNAAQIAENPDLACEVERPMILIIKAMR